MRKHEVAIDELSQTEEDSTPEISRPDNADRFL
jgi:hypothetical protein